MSQENASGQKQMVRFKSEKLGEIEYDETQVISFSEGMLGFPDYTRYVLVQSEKGPFVWLQSLDEPTLAFVVMDPWLYLPEYEPDIPDADVEELEFRAPYNMSVFCVVTVPPNPEEATINLMGPVVVNLDTGQARQVAILNSEYTTRHRLVNPASSQQEG